jgi:hypothetical protein
MARTPSSSITTLPGAPGKPTFGVATTTSLVVSWVPPAGGATSYELQRAPSATGSWTTVQTVTAPTSTVTDTGLTVGTTYWYQVRAVTPAGASAYSAFASRPTLPDISGTITFSNIGATSVRLTWGAAAGATSYRVERAPTTARGSWYVDADRTRRHGHDVRQHRPQRERQVLVPRAGDERVR